MEFIEEIGQVWSKKVNCMWTNKQSKVLLTDINFIAAQVKECQTLYRAWLKCGPQVAKPGSSGNQQQEKNSPNLRTAFWLSPVNISTLESCSETARFKNLFGNLWLK